MKDFTTGTQRAPKWTRWHGFPCWVGFLSAVLWRYVLRNGFFWLLLASGILGGLALVWLFGLVGATLGLAIWALLMIGGVILLVRTYTRHFDK